MTTRSQSQLIRRLRELGPFRSDREASQALSAVVRALGELLDGAEREAVAVALPAAAAKQLRAAPVAAQLPSTAVLERIAASQGIRLARAIERSEVVLRALGEFLSPTARARLVHALPEVEPLLAPRELTAERRPEDRVPVITDDLAGGKPGSRHPLSSASSAARAHRHSVARSSDPHADTRLSSARGLTQERESRTLASARLRRSGPRG